MLVLKFWQTVFSKFRTFFNSHVNRGHYEVVAWIFENYPEEVKSADWSNFNTNLSIWNSSKRVKMFEVLVKHLEPKLFSSMCRYPECLELFLQLNPKKEEIPLHFVIRDLKESGIKYIMIIQKFFNIPKNEMKSYLL